MQNSGKKKPQRFGLSTEKVLKKSSDLEIYEYYFVTTAIKEGSQTNNKKENNTWQFFLLDDNTG